MLSFDNIIITSRNAMAREGLRDDEEILAYLPMAWVGDHIFSYGQFYCAGFTVNCPESSATSCRICTKSALPTSSPRRASGKIFYDGDDPYGGCSLAQAPDVSLFHACGAAGRGRKLAGQSVGRLDTLLYVLGHVLVYGPLKDHLGLGRIRLAYTAGEAIGPEIFTFYRSLGINVKQLYGMTEASVFVCVQPDGEVNQIRWGRLCRRWS